MANRVRGEVDFDLNGQKYTLCFDHAAMIELEDLLDKGIVAITKEMQAWQQDPDRIRLKWIRALLFAGLKRHQPKLSLDDVSDLMGQPSQSIGIMDKINEALGKAFGSDEKADDVRPTNGDARSGTGQGPSPSTSPTATGSTPSGG